ncbi:MAG: hypothetical protein F4213_21265 [Boseongicola sp. SB0677_bin_26]|nr:hypothetical protein [Boseongicola sp. SB0665_bin_10]MYG28512.1 hypothetical protein [Boseongicola sp. SB0677_bin_26]
MARFCDPGAHFMWLTCPNCSSEHEFDDAPIPAREQELECTDCEHAWRETAAPGSTQGPGARP